MPDSEYPMRINKYLAHKKYATRRAADEIIARGLVTINGKVAVLGDKVREKDVVDVKSKRKTYRYLAYFKPRGVITHSPQGTETEIAEIISLPGVFPVGRLDKDSYGLIILTDDGRLTEALLSPDNGHEKEYEVLTRDKLPGFFKKHMEAGVDIGGYTTKPCTVTLRGDKKFSIVLTEGKKHQIRRMCGAFGQSAIELKRVRVMNIKLGNLKAGQYRKITGDELRQFLKAVGLGA
jgi:23S rRNA pseudouridine2604 synthase